MKTENPFVKLFIYLVVVPWIIFFTFLLWVWGAGSTSRMNLVMLVFPTVFFIFLIYQAVQWRRRQKNKKDDSSD